MVTTNAIAATGAGLITCCSTNPLWVVKTRFQVQGIQSFKSQRVFTRDYTSTLGALVRIGREEGFRGLYRLVHTVFVKLLCCSLSLFLSFLLFTFSDTSPFLPLRYHSGLGPSIFGVANVTIMLPLYEELKIFVAKKLKKEKSDLHPVEIATTSGIAKCVASSITYPHEVLRSRMQISGRCAAILPTIKEVCVPTPNPFFFLFSLHYYDSFYCTFLDIEN